MTSYKRALFIITAAIVAATGTLLLLGLLGQVQPVWADPAAITRYVAPDGNDGNDCSSYADRCRTVQRAVDVATPGDEILVATGVYTGVQARGTMTQVLYISQTVTIRGGYNADFSAWNPDAYPVELDAEGQGRVIYITGNITLTLEALEVTGGATSNDGGGIYVASDAHSIISGCQIYSNTSASAGGVRLYGVSDATLRGNDIYSNTASGGAGGGVYLYNSPNAILMDNAIHHNNTSSSGGGIYLGGSSNARLMNNEVYDNIATIWYGGGIMVSASPGATLVGNHVYSNTASTGGGVCIGSSNDATLAENQVCSNTANTGGGIYLTNSPTATLTDNEIFSNTANSTGGGGIYLTNSPTATLNGNLIFRNTANQGGGMYVAVGSYGAALVDNDIYRNEAGQYGGGVFLFQSDGAALTGNTIFTNTADNYGGGIYISSCLTVTLATNSIRDNLAGDGGGGVHLQDSRNAALTSNEVFSNTVNTGSGGGVFFSSSDNASLVNNMVAENHLVSGNGAGVHLSDSTGRFLHTTIARNTGGQGVYLATGSTLWMTNTILVSHTVGIEVNSSNTATLDHTLWGAGGWANNADWANAGLLVTGTLAANWWEEPRFVDYGDGPYHLDAGSGAIDKGVSAGVLTDMDGDKRPIDGDLNGAALVDLGADEFRLRRIYLPLVLRNRQST